MRKRLLTLGEPAPWFSAPTTANPNFFFDTVAGRYVVVPLLRRIIDRLASTPARRLFTSAN